MISEPADGLPLRSAKPMPSASVRAAFQEGGAVVHGLRKISLYTGHECLSNRVPPLGRIAACDVVFELPLDIAQEGGCAEAEKVGL